MVSILTMYVTWKHHSGYVNQRFKGSWKSTMIYRLSRTFMLIGSSLPWNDMIHVLYAPNNMYLLYPLIHSEYIIILYAGTSNSETARLDVPAFSTVTLGTRPPCLWILMNLPLYMRDPFWKLKGLFSDWLTSGLWRPQELMVTVEIAEYKQEAVSCAVGCLCVGECRETEQDLLISRS